MARKIVYQRPPLAKYQLDAIFCAERYAEIEASTKSGKTHGALAWLFEQAAIGGKPGRNYWWVAPVFSQAEIAYRRLKLALPDTIRKCNDTALLIRLVNGASIVFKSGEKPDNLYGEDVYAAVIDEASRVREESWWALRSTLTKTEAPVRIIGNVKGRRNWYYQLCRKAQAGEPGHRYSKITARDAVEAGILTAEEVEDAKRTLPERIFRELFDAEASDDAGNPFGMSAIRSCVKPPSAESPVAFGVDLAKSIDWTVVIGLDASGAVCRLERFQLPWQETMARIKAIIGPTPALIDSTGVGDPIVEALQRDLGESVVGYKFTSESKQRLMEGLAVAIQSGEVAFPEDAVNELCSFEYHYTGTGVRYSAPEGAHDDIVCALALALVRKRQSWMTVSIPSAPEAPSSYDGPSALEGLNLG